MLPIYKAISFVSIIDKGGRTKPWVVLVKAANTIRPYVVKLFETSLIKTRDSVTNEVLGNVLAKEFNLPVPHAALIDFDDDFKATITDIEVLDILKNRDNRLKFGSELLEGYLSFDYEAYQLNDVTKMIDIDSVYAFDNLIRNADRNGQLKPNILIKKKEAFLIDHELGFEIDRSIFNELDGWNWNSKFYNYHIFSTFLKNSPLKIKKEYFNEFEEYLKYLNINNLDSYFNQLKQNNFSDRNHSLIREYLAFIKRNSSKFVNIMRSTIL